MKVPGGKVVMWLMVLGFCGCSSFNRDWRAAGRQPVPADSMTGRWEGLWKSDVNQHEGRLQCLMTRQDDAHYQARFRATYKKILHFSYAVPLEVQPHNGGWEFNGQENLGKLAGGVYTYEGRAFATNHLLSTYRSKYDHGIFEMQRPGGN